MHVAKALDIGGEDSICNNNLGENGPRRGLGEGRLPGTSGSGKSPSRDVNTVSPPAMSDETSIPNAEDDGKRQRHELYQVGTCVEIGYATCSPSKFYDLWALENETHD